MKAYKIWGITEIAEALGENPRTVAQWHRRGKLPEPTERLAMGPVWTVQAITPWFANRKLLERIDHA